MKKSISGFTIVELLIVIVVIAILAAISVVAYTGIQQRANIASATSSASQAIKAVRAYVAATDSYPVTSNGSFCLTPSTGCTYAGNPVANNSNLINNIKQYASLPESIPEIATDNKGLIYQYNSTMTYNGSLQPARIYYAIQGSASTCGLSNLSNSGGYAMTTPSIGYTATYGSYTLCFISIPGPSA